MDLRLMIALAGMTTFRPADYYIKQAHTIYVSKQTISNNLVDANK
jgi:hypothetical protein